MLSPPFTLSPPTRVVSLPSPLLRSSKTALSYAASRFSQLYCCYGYSSSFPPFVAGLEWQSIRGFCSPRLFSISLAFPARSVRRALYLTPLSPFGALLFSRLSSAPRLNLVFYGHLPIFSSVAVAVAVQSGWILKVIGHGGILRASSSLLS